MVTKIGYLMNIYPVTSATFIRREILALEAQGLEVSRYAIRRWDDELVDPQDRAELARVQYLLSGHALRLILGFFLEIIRNPIGLARALKTWAVFVWQAKSGLIKHIAYLLEAISLKQHMRTEGIEHLHAHFSTNTATVALLANRLGAAGYSFTAHGPDEFIDWGPSSLKRKVAGARFVIAISKFCRTQLTLASGQQFWNKIHIVGCGVDVDDFSPSDAPFDASAPFVCVGRLCPQKAQVLIVEAVARVVKKHPRVQVLLIGDGESRADVEHAIADNNLQENVKILGWQSNADVRAILGNARALLLPSFAEGLPVAIMESFALGRPVISTFIAGIPELVDQDTGWIIPAGSVEDIAMAIDSAMAASEKTLAKMGKVGRTRILERHDVQANAAALKNLIEDAIATERAH